jgi:hypothetical protein
MPTVTFRFHLEQNRTIRIHDFWFRPVDYVVTISDKGPAPATVKDITKDDREWEILVTPKANLQTVTIDSPTSLEVHSVRITDYCLQLNMAGIREHNESRLEFVHVPAAGNTAASWLVSEICTAKMILWRSL